jgi:hypothetical protein
MIYCVHLSILRTDLFFQAANDGMVVGKMDVWTFIIV